MKVVCFSDCHITEKTIPELEEVFKEILKYSKGVEHLVCVGDYYDKKTPNASEIEFGTKWAIKFKEAYKNFYMVTGNHTDIDGKMSSVSYMKHLFITVNNDLELDGTYYGHFTIKESMCGFNESKSIKDLQHNLTILGHQHSYQDIDNRVIHPGSCRYVDFGEVNDTGKYILLIDDCTYLPIKLNKVRPMIEVDSCSKLVGVPKDTMVRVVIKDFKRFILESDELKKWEDEFFLFKVKLDFDTKQIATNIQTVNGNTDLDILKSWLNSIENLEVKDEIIKEVTSMGLC